MPEIIVPIDMLFDVARDFADGAGDLAILQDKLEKKMKFLENSWNDASNQQFFRYYRELDQQLNVCNQIMDVMAREMNAIAERYDDLNKG